MKYLVQILTLVSLLTVSLLTGCGIFSAGPKTVTNSSDYLEIQATPNLVIPEDMDHIEIDEIWKIPEIVERPLPLVFPRGAPRPAAIIGDAHPDLVRIQSLGERSWMVVQRRPETVWPVVKQWFQDNSVEIEWEDAKQGLLISSLIDLDADIPDSLSSLIREEKATAGVEGKHDRVALRVENGIRRGSTEVHLRYLNSDSPGNFEEFSWPSESTYTAVERAILGSLANYDASGYVNTHSRLAEQIALLPKAEILIDEAVGYPYLRVNVDYRRAWATVNKALENANINVIQQNSSEQFIDVEISNKVVRGNKRHLLNRLLRGAQPNEGARPKDIRILISASESGHDVAISAIDDGVTLSVEYVQQILLVIQEYAI